VWRMLLAGVEALGAKAHGVNQSQLLSRVSQGLQPLAQSQLRQQLILRLQALQEQAQLDLSQLRQRLTQALQAFLERAQSVRSRLQQPLTRQSQVMLERLQSARSPSMQQAQPLSQAFLERHRSDRLQQTPQRTYPLQVTLERLRLVLSRWLQTTSSAFQGLNLHRRLELSLRLQRADVAVTGVSADGLCGGALVWGKVVPGQDSSWSTIDDSQTPSWSTIDDSQTPNWEEVA
jgi:hypothetical protein